MKRLFICLPVLLSVVATAHAADVAQRMSCADIKNQVDTLGARDNLSDDEAKQLSDLKIKYRRDCVKRAAGGRGAQSIAATRTLVTNDDTATTTPDAQSGTPCDAPDEHGCCPGETYTDMGAAGFNCCPSDGGMCFTPMVLNTDAPTTDAAPQKTDEEIAAEINANIAAGLCADGTKPNKYGCCADELFRDMGGTFACCPKSGGDCFPPMN